MKKIEKLKLNSLSKSELSNREMQSLNGGTCACKCAYDTSMTAYNFGDAAGGGTECSCACSCATQDASAYNYNLADSMDHRNHS